MLKDLWTVLWVLVLALAGSWAFVDYGVQPLLAGSISLTGLVGIGFGAASLVVGYLVFVGDALWVEKYRERKW
jgi:hypothetical protein